MSIANYLTALDAQRDQLARNLVTMGVQACRPKNSPHEARVSAHPFASPSCGISATTSANDSFCPSRRT